MSAPAPAVRVRLVATGELRVLVQARWAAPPADLAPGADTALGAPCAAPFGAVCFSYRREGGGVGTHTVVPQDLAAAPAGARVLLELPWPTTGETPSFRAWVLVDVLAD